MIVHPDSVFHLRNTLQKTWEGQVQGDRIDDIDMDMHRDYVSQADHHIIQ